MGGIGLSCKQPQPNTSHTCTHIHTQTHIHISAYPCTTICTCTTIKNIQYPDIMHTIRTQYAHNTHIYTSTTQNTEHTICTHIVLIFITYNDISKNSIIQLYTNYIQTIYILLTLLMRWPKYNNIDTYKNIIYVK